MREVDTSALRGVARSLGIGNPATVRTPVVFDDDNLQQIWDATKYGVLPIVEGLFSFQLAAGGAVGTARLPVTLESLYEPGVSGNYGEELARRVLDIGNADVWITRCNVQALDAEAANLEEVQVGFREDSGEETELLFRGSAAAQTSITEATGLFLNVARSTNADTIDPRLPLKLSTEHVDQATSVLPVLVRSGAGGDVTCLFQFRLLFTLKGTPLWYEV